MSDQACKPAIHFPSPLPRTQKAQQSLPALLEAFISYVGRTLLQDDKVVSYPDLEDDKEEYLYLVSPKINRETPKESRLMLRLPTRYSLVSCLAHLRTRTERGRMTPSSSVLILQTTLSGSQTHPRNRYSG
ncbi:hypothetical protein AOL_s00080g91 [Orbilia oligospora ATCC 24927]|uniref:Uncharacterized protein n=2 Tax=Orbilia oligospora TaxID=2813651 RepID=G1XE56_ARTOA|nr:hypothetical protein AOL_s00080g91 [Orbilia oligospora ATCC 24927]EGX48462.1 hypothetical protein AOL_s00080g91 [Orbilia oligospora ATCC 24927]